MIVTTTEFEGLTREATAANQLPEARVLVTNHPLGGTDEETISKWAQDSADSIMRLFLT